MTREEAMDQLCLLMAYNYDMTGEEPDYVTVWNRIQDLTDYIWYHQPDPGEWEIPEGVKKAMEEVHS